MNRSTRGDEPADAGGEARRAREEALRGREERLAQRENAADANRDFAQTRSDRLEERVSRTAEANERLVVASLHSQQQTEIAEEANARKDDFLAMLSHELRNPLAPIRNAAAVLGLISHADPRVTWVREVIERQTEQMARLLDDLLDAARVRSGKIVLKLRPVAMQEVIDEAVETCRPLADARAQQLTVVLPAQPAHVNGDPVRLTQVFSNLLNNACKYTREGGAIRLDVQVGETMLVVRVQDEGRGIAPEALARIFELFSQEDRSLAHAQGGLGIGLSLVRGLVVLHGGTVEARSAGIDLGSEFIVTLPRLLGPWSAASPVEPASTEPKRGLRIVLIEDNRDANDSLAVLLTLSGHEVVSAYDGVSGVALVLAQRPQLVLCDIGLPGMDGLAVAQRLSDELQEALPVMVALTGYSQDEDRARAVAAGFRLHLTKPVDPEVLLALLDQQAERLYGEPP